MLTFIIIQNPLPTFRESIKSIMVSTNNKAISTLPEEQNNLIVDISSNFNGIDISSDASTLELEPKTPPISQNVVCMDECELFGNFIASQVALIAQINPTAAANLQKNIMEDCKKRLAKYETRQQQGAKEKAKVAMATVQQCNNMQSSFNLPANNHHPNNSQWSSGGPSTSTQKWNGPMNAWAKNLLD